MGRGEEFIERLRAGEVVVGDGAMGTELLARGLSGAELDAAPVRHPAAVSEIHSAHAAAGAGLLRTATFAANGPRLDIAGLKGDVAEINSAAVALARAAAGEQAVVAGAMGPCFGPDVTELSDAELEKIHHSQAKVLAAAGVDLLICETFTGLAQCAAALRGALKTGLPVIAQLAPLKPATTDGVEFGPALTALAEIGAAAVGLNCGSSESSEVDVLRAARLLLKDVPRTAFPNAGTPVETDGVLLYPMDAAAIATRAARLRDAGARLIGGCCGTGPEGIAAVTEKLS